MANTPEKKVKDKVVKLLKQHGVYYFFPATYGMGRSGVPDIICCIKGKFLASHLIIFSSILLATVRSMPNQSFTSHVQWCETCVP